MQILKGRKLKSVTVESILKSTDSLCCVYYEQDLPFENYYLDSNVATLKHLKHLKYYLQEFIECEITDKIYDYFIIYTNNKEKELSELIRWLDGKESDFNCRCILVTCR